MRYVIGDIRYLICCRCYLLAPLVSTNEVSQSRAVAKSHIKNHLSNIANQKLPAAIFVARRGIEPLLPG